MRGNDQRFVSTAVSPVSVEWPEMCEQMCRFVFSYKKNKILRHALVTTTQSLCLLLPAVRNKEKNPRCPQTEHDVLEAIWDVLRNTVFLRVVFEASAAVVILG